MIRTIDQLKDTFVTGALVTEQMMQDLIDTLASLSGGDVIEITYDELVSMIDNSELTPQAKYLITDYRTSHEILNAGLDDNEQAPIYEAPIEPLIVTANDNSSLNTIAYSTIHRNDIIYYDYRNDLVNIDGDLILRGASKGIILRRIDTLQNNDITGDFRNIVQRRYRVNIPLHDPEIPYSRGAWVIFGSNVYVSGFNNNNGEFDSSSWLEVNFIEDFINNDKYIGAYFFTNNYICNLPTLSDDFIDLPIFADYSKVYNNKIELNYLFSTILYGLSFHVESTFIGNDIKVESLANCYFNEVLNNRISTNSLEDIVSDVFINNEITKYDSSIYQSILKTLNGCKINRVFDSNVIIESINSTLELNSSNLIRYISNSEFYEFGSNNSLGAIIENNIIEGMSECDFDGFVQNNVFKNNLNQKILNNTINYNSDFPYDEFSAFIQQDGESNPDVNVIIKNDTNTFFIDVPYLVREDVGTYYVDVQNINGLSNVQVIFNANTNGGLIPNYVIRKDTENSRIYLLTYVFNGTTYVLSDSVFTSSYFAIRNYRFFGIA